MSKKKRKFLVKVAEPQFIHYNATNKETGNVEDTTIMKGKYAFPWRAITSLGDRVARARAMARACVVSRHIILAIKEGLEEELNRSAEIFKARFEKEKRIIKGV